MTRSVPGSFTISLDFELMWGVFDKRSVSEYGENILATREAISRMLMLFSEYNIGVTWAAVGLLLCRDRDEMISRIKEVGLDIKRPDLRSYIEGSVGRNHKDDPYHFGMDIVDDILTVQRQELASHSFCHYGVQEEYADLEGFTADTDAVKRLFKDRNIELSSYIFARNQISEPYLQVVKDRQFKIYRGLAPHKLYSSQMPEQLTSTIRAGRLLDTYFPIAQINSSLINEKEIANTQANRFLRPCNRIDKPFKFLKIHRVKSEMTKAARLSGSYHLWWHPHNFGKRLDQQLGVLEELLQHYQMLSSAEGWQSKNMSELVQDSCRVSNRAS